MTQESKTYPIGGYAPGNYSCKCVTCKKEFTGDKRAVQCEPCAIEMVEYKPKPNSVYPVTPEECIKQESIEEAAEKHWKMQYIMSLDESTKPYIIQDFIAGVKSEAAKNYWYEQFKNKK